MNVIVHPFIYQYKDHLGNIRLTYNDANSDGNVTASEIIEESNYYPFGLQHKGLNHISMSTNIGQKIKYNGKELQDELGLNITAMDYRQYDSTIGRFNVIDRLTELTYSITPYRFAFNNPIFFNNPTGLIEEGPMKHNDYYRIGGTVYFDPNVGPKNLPSGAVYIGKTYTDTKGTFWDEKGVPTYKAEVKLRN